MDTPFNIPLFDYLEIKEQIKDPRIDEKLRFNITDGYIEKIRETVYKPQSFDRQVFSRKGKGKSVFSLKSMELRDMMLAERLGKSYEPEKFDFNRIHFTTESLEVYLRENSEKMRNTDLLIDEQIKSWGVGSFINMQKVAVWTETLRKKSVSFIYCSPTGRYRGMFQYDFLIQPIAITESDEELGTVLLSGVFTQNNAMIGSILTSKPSKFVEEGYDKLKDEALEMFTTLELNEQDKYQKIVDSLIEKYDMFSWHDSINIYRGLSKKERDEMKLVPPPPLTKGTIRALLAREKYKYSITELDIISDLVMLEIGLLAKKKDKLVEVNEDGEDGLAEEERGGTEHIEDRDAPQG